MLCHKNELILSDFKWFQEKLSANINSRAMMICQELHSLVQCGGIEVLEMLIICQGQQEGLLEM